MCRQGFPGTATNPRADASRQILLGLSQDLDRLLNPLPHRPLVGPLLPAIEQVALWLMRQDEYPCKRRLDNYKAVEWAVAAKELGFPKETDGKRVVKEWRESCPLSDHSLPATQTRVIKR
jgi:hypothetical protein